MGVCVRYWAIPPYSELYASLQRDLTFNTLMSLLITYGRELYRPSDFFLQELEETIDYFLEVKPSALGPNPKQSVDAFLSLLERTRIEYPLIETRVTMIEKSASDIQEKLWQALERANVENAAEIVARTMWADGSIRAPHTLRLDQEPSVGSSKLGLISSAAVKKGASVLSNYSSQQLFPEVTESRNSWHRQNYERWKEVYLAVAKCEEAFIIEVS